ncbi:Na/Pi cotransporter family protein [Sulfuriroseicoccus oceanibius]|uniref:Na/Pi cotransporter family protein n=1 Tax=Sulfuriroseicoccus oceanibius TaxID=2707525 RepID=A0A6B3LF55_9BACT|nr:Na/Pi cotransporter family protein [Sulfuriroseicoccus oceanibius]QQL45018.1 Na/Pi cotransporter family protein [Sulfuriroseicoccus oceanibius]
MLSRTPAPRIIRPIALGLVALAILGSLLLPTHAADPLSNEASGSELNLTMMLIQLLGGLALFLFGMEMMGDGLKAAAGSKMKDILARFTTNRVKAAITGSVVTALIQSSSITTVLVVGFVSAGLMSLTQSVGVIMGANVGTTITAQIVAFKVEEAALAMVAVGFAMIFIGKRDRIHQIGRIIMGLGLVFVGMDVMSDGMAPLRTYEPFIELMAQMQQPALGIVIGALFTALVQSSSATTGIVIALASQGILPLSAGIALIFGANIGTCVTAMLATLGKGREAKQVAFVHVVFNVIGVLIWLRFIPDLASFVESFSPPPEQEGLSQHELFAASVPRQVANAHAVFNICNTLLLLPFAGLIARLTQRVLPRKEGELLTIKYLDKHALDVPSLALHSARLEVARLGDRALRMLDGIPALIVKRDQSVFACIARQQEQVQTLDREIANYMAHIQCGDLSQEEAAEYQSIMLANSSLVAICNIIADDTVEIARRSIYDKLRTSQTITELAEHLIPAVRDALSNAVLCVRSKDPADAELVLAANHHVKHIANECFRSHGHRFESPADLPLFRLKTNLVDALRRIYSHSKKIAYTVIPAPEPKDASSPSIAKR